MKRVKAKVDKPTKVIKQLETVVGLNDLSKYQGHLLKEQVSAYNQVENDQVVDIADALQTKEDKQAMSELVKPLTKEERKARSLLVKQQKLEMRKLAMEDYKKRADLFDKFIKENAEVLAMLKFAHMNPDGSMRFSLRKAMKNQGLDANRPADVVKAREKILGALVGLDPARSAAIADAILSRPDDDAMSMVTTSELLIPDERNLASVALSNVFNLPGYGAPPPPPPPPSNLLNYASAANSQPRVGPNAGFNVVQPQASQEQQEAGVVPAPMAVPNDSNPPEAQVAMGDLAEMPAPQLLTKTQLMADRAAQEMREVSQAIEQLEQQRKADQEFLSNYNVSIARRNRIDNVVPKDKIDAVLDALLRTGGLSDIEVVEYGIGAWNRGSKWDDSGSGNKLPTIRRSKETRANEIRERELKENRRLSDYEKAYNVVSFAGITREELQKRVEQRLAPPAQKNLANASGSNDPLD